MTSRNPRVGGGHSRETGREVRLPRRGPPGSFRHEEASPDLQLMETKEHFRNVKMAACCRVSGELNKMYGGITDFPKVCDKWTKGGTERDKGKQSTSC